MTNVDTNKLEAYTQIKNAEDLVQDTIGQFSFDFHFFKPANDAIDFLKDHLDDNQFQIELATPAIIKAINFLDNFINETKKEVARLETIEKEKNAKAKKAKQAVDKVFDNKINPAIKTIMTELAKLPSIEGYNSGYTQVEMRSFIGTPLHKPNLR